MNSPTFALLALALALCGCGLREERQWPAQPEEVGPLLFSADGNSLIAGGKDAIRIWDPTTGTLKLQLPTGKAPMEAAISPDGRLLMLSTSHHEGRSVSYGLELWDIKRASLLGRIEENHYALAFSPDSSKIAAAFPAPNGTSEIRIWLVPSLTLQTSFARPFVSSLCFSPDAQLLASGETNAVQLLNVQTGQSVRALAGPNSSWVLGSRFTTNGATLSSVVTSVNSQKSAIWTWDVGTGKMKSTVELEHNVGGLPSFSADGKRVAIRFTWYVFSRSDQVEVWDTSAGHKLGTVKSRNFTWSVALSPDGGRLAIGFQAPNFRVPAPIGVWKVP